MSFYIIALDDNTDGNAYVQDVQRSETFPRAIAIAIPLLLTHDHACIIDCNIYSSILVREGAPTYASLLPYSFLLDTGHNFPLSEIVNKL